MGQNEILPLPGLFARALTLAEVGGKSGSTDELSSLLKQCEHQVDRIGVFSSNEEIEDVPTGDLKYFLVSSLIGDLAASTEERDPSARKQALEAAQEAYKRFLRRCEQYDLVPDAAQSSGPLDAQTKRQLKIERFQKEKLAHSQMKELQASLAPVTIVNGSKQACSDEDAEREIWLLKIELAVLKAFEQSSQIEQELDMLSHALSIPEEERNRPLPPPPADLLGELHQAAAQLGRQRQQIAANVFKPSHRLPTRSLREQADIEIAQAHEQAHSQAEAAKQRAELESDEDYMLQKQRNWDDWKDDHERGAGNNKLRPTA